MNARRDHLPVPHREDALLLDEILRATDDRLEARMVVRPGTAFSDARGNLPAWAGPEIMAQAVSALAGRRSQAREGRPAAVGLLLGIRGFEAPGGQFSCGEELKIEVVQSTDAGAGQAVFDCWIECGGAIVAHGTLTVYQPPDDSFIDRECARDD